MFDRTRSDVQEPEIEERGDETLVTHPAFAQISAFRTSGAAVLYGSDFQHGGFITLKVHTSTLHRRHAHDRYHNERELIAVSLSEAQWASLLSSLNMGEGVPCTIQRIQGEQMPRLPMVDRQAQAAAEVRKTVEDAIARLDALSVLIDGMGLPKGKTQDLKAEVAQTRRQLDDSLPFVVRSFDEHMENTVEKARVEVHGMTTRILTQAGLSTDRSNPLLSLGMEGDDE